MTKKAGFVFIITSLLISLGVSACDDSSSENSKCPECQSEENQDCEKESDRCINIDCNDGQKCNPSTGKCEDDISTKACDEDERPEKATECRCVDGSWFCIFPDEDVTPPESVDPCADVTCARGQICNPETGKCEDEKSLGEKLLKDRLLYTEKQNICKRGGNNECEKVQLRGFNIGLWLSRSIWGLPIEAVEYSNVQDQPDVNNLEIWYALRQNSNHFSEAEINTLSETLYSNFITSEDIKRIKLIGANAVRIPFEWSHLMTCDDKKQNCEFLYENDKDLFLYMDWVVEECRKNDIYVIFDLHIAQGNLNSSGNREKTEFLDEPYRSEISKLWNRVSEHFKYNPTVAGYDLVNEPEVINTKYGNTAIDRAKTLADFYNDIYKVIRSNDDDHIIFMEEDTVFSGVSGDSDFGQRPYIGLLPDPADYSWQNVAYSVHNYFWNNALMKSCETEGNIKKDAVEKCKIDKCKEKNGYYETVSKECIPIKDIIKNRIDAKLGNKTDKVVITKVGCPDKVPECCTAGSIYGTMNSYDIPIYVGEFNSLFDIEAISKATGKNLPELISNADNALSIWEDEMKMYDEAGLSYTAWTYKSSGIYWQSLIYWGMKPETKTNLLKDPYKTIMDIFSRESYKDMILNWKYCNLFGKHFHGGEEFVCSKVFPK